MSEAGAESERDSCRAALRGCWADLKKRELRAPDSAAFASALRKRHADALAALIGSGELDAAAAGQIDAAFAEAVAHAQMEMSLCYIMIPMEYTPRDDLTRQIAILEEMAAKSEIDPATVAQARAALERDIAWLAQFQAGGTAGALEQVPVGNATVQAAKALAELLSEKS